MQKPILPNGYTYKGTQISRLIFADTNIEIYQTKNGVYLNLLKKECEIQPSKKAKFGVCELKIARKNYLVFPSKKSYETSSQDLLKNLTKISGFDALAGMSELKKQLIQDLINPIKHKERYAKFKISIPNGILLYGPPGCGKTFIVQKLAEELEFAFLEVKHSDVSSPYIHGGVGKIAEVFEQARQKAPAIVFIDELDGLLPSRAELSGSQSHKLEEINEFLQHLNNAGKNDILVVGATNQIDLLDEAATRSGRFDKKFFVPPPDLKARMALFEMYLVGRPLQTLDYEELAIKTQDYSCSDIELICNDSARSAAAQGLECITQELIENTIKAIKPSIKIKNDEI